ncbi:MAG: glycosyltransferase [Patescibacteria group bacterium]
MKILFVGNEKPNNIHKAFADTIKADFWGYSQNSTKTILKNMKNIPKGYDIYLTEGLFAYVYLAKKMGYLNKKAKIVNIFGDPRLFQILEGKQFCFKTLRIKKYSTLKRKLMINAIKGLYGAICIGNFQKNLLKKISPKTKEIVVYPFIDSGFLKNNSKLDKNNIIFIGNGPDHYCKGLDFLIKICLELKINLFILGKDLGHLEKKYRKFKEINFVGFQDKKGLEKYMKNSSLCCHFGRGEAFGAAVLECMAAGIPAMVSNLTGVKEAVGKARKDFVFSFKEKDRIKKEIGNYFKKSTKERQKLGKEFKKEAKFFEKKRCVNIFKGKFNELLK